MSQRRVTIQVATMLRERGYDEECNCYYQNGQFIKTERFNHNSIAGRLSIPDPYDAANWIRDNGYHVYTRVVRSCWFIYVDSCPDGIIQYDNNIIYEDEYSAFKAGLVYALNLIPLQNT